MKLLQLSAVTLVLLSPLCAQEKENTLEASLRTMFSGVHNDNSNDTYATAIGVTLKYKKKLVQNLKGVVALRSTKDLSLLSGENNHSTDELSSSKKEYVTLSEAYLDYKYNNLSLKLGRQNIDTPLADSDDIRMIPNSFEAYTLGIDLGELNLIGGYLDKWQGTDAGLDNSWTKTGDTVFIGANYRKKDVVELNIWGYNIANGVNASQSLYVDVASFIKFGAFQTTFGLQYLKQQELDNSGIKADVYGAMVETTLKDFGVMIAYNASSKQSVKQSLSGFGGGTLFTSMDTMILDEITEDRDAFAISGAFSYAIGELTAVYAYGDFSGDANSKGVKEHIVEHDLGLEYTPNKDLTLSCVYVLDKNKEYRSSQDFNSQNLRFFGEYSF